MRIPFTFLVLISLSVFWSLSAHAGGFQLYLAGSRQFAMGHAGVGSAEGASAMFFNPGALAFIPKSNIEVGGALVFSNTTFLSEMTFRITQTETRSFSPIYFYGAWKPGAESKLTLGIGVNSPFGYMIKWPEDWEGKLISRELSLTSLFIQPTFSYRITPKVSLGAGLVFGNVNLLVRQALPGTGQPNNESPSMSIAGNGYGWGFNAGIYFQPDETFSFGISLRSPLKPMIKGDDLDFDVQPVLVDSFRATEFTSDLTLPGVLSIGIGYRPQETVTLLFDVNYTGWMVYDTLRINFNDNSELLKDINAPRNFKSVFAFRMGGEYIVNENLTVRMGGYYENSPAEAEYVSPDLPDADKIGVTAGLGLMNMLEHLSLDIGVEYSITGERTIDGRNRDINSDLLGGTYQSNAFKAGLGLSYSF